MRSSLKKIERIMDILDLNGDVLSYKYTDEEIRFDLGEEQLSSIFTASTPSSNCLLAI